MFCFGREDFASNSQPPSDAPPGKFYKKDRFKSKEVHSKYKFEPNGYTSSKVTTENTSASEVSMNVPQATYVHMPFSTNSKFNQDDYYFFGTYIARVNARSYIARNAHVYRSVRTVAIDYRIYSLLVR